MLLNRSESYVLFTRWHRLDAPSRPDDGSNKQTQPIHDQLFYIIIYWYFVGSSAKLSSKLSVSCAELSLRDSPQCRLFYHIHTSLWRIRTLFHLFDLFLAASFMIDGSKVAIHLMIPMIQPSNFINIHSSSSVLNLNLVGDDKSKFMTNSLIEFFPLAV